MHRPVTDACHPAYIADGLGTRQDRTIKLGNFGESSYNSKEVREAFNILEKAFILHLVYPVTAMHAPALPALKRAPKLMWLDTGLVNFAANIQLKFCMTVR